MSMLVSFWSALLEFIWFQLSVSLSCLIHFHCRRRFKKHSYNPKRIPQFEITTYLAKKRVLLGCFIKIHRKNLSVLWV